MRFLLRGKLRMWFQHDRNQLGTQRKSECRLDEQHNGGAGSRPCCYWRMGQCSVQGDPALKVEWPCLSLHITVWTPVVSPVMLGIVPFCQAGSGDCWQLECWAGHQSVSPSLAARRHNWAFPGAASPQAIVPPTTFWRTKTHFESNSVILWF